MKTKRALFLSGGWDGHKPEQFVHILSEALKTHHFECTAVSALDILEDAERLKGFDLISPCWTMGALNEAQSKGLQAAIRGGVGLGGIHGGMGDAFRGNLDYEWMVGGHFVGHPHVGDYVVRVKNLANPITSSLPPSFPYRSEQYYMMIDPAVQVLAETEYTYEGVASTMPVAWVRRWGKGRVFYSALGHAPEELSVFPDSLTLAVQGLRWAAGDL